MSVDFDALKERLTVQGELFSHALDEHAVRKLLRGRAERLAGRESTKDRRRHLFDLVIGRRGAIEWGFPSHRLRELRRVQVTRLPFLPAPFCGLFQIRGTLHPLVDLQPAVGSADELSHGDLCLAAVLYGPSRTLGVRLDEVTEVRSVNEGDLRPAPEESPGELVANLTHDVVHVVDVDTLLQSRSIQLSPEEESS